MPFVLWHANNFIVFNSSQRFWFIFLNYRNPTAACQTKANSKKKTGIMGNTSTIGLNIMYASGKRASNKLSIIKPLYRIY